MKAAGLCALVALAATLAVRGGVLAQVQQAPKPTVPVEAPMPPVEAPKPPHSVKPKPSAEELERWRQTIVRTPRPEKGCFIADYPATAWTKVSCGKPPKKTYPTSRTTG
jgi:hypothetical protein